jgi:hypothetical protein
VTTRYFPRYIPLEDLTEEVVFPLVRRRVSATRIEDEDDPKGISTRRVLVVQTMGLVLFVAAFALCVLAWLAR